MSSPLPQRDAEHAECERVGAQLRRWHVATVVAASLALIFAMVCSAGRWINAGTTVGIVVLLAASLVCLVGFWRTQRRLDYLNRDL